jgi:hypothetical protein
MPKRDASPKRKPMANRLIELNLSQEVTQSAAQVLLLLGEHAKSVGKEGPFCRINTEFGYLLVGANTFSCDDIPAPHFDDKEAFGKAVRRWIDAPVLVLVLTGHRTTSVKLLWLYTEEELNLLQSWTALDSVYEELFGSASDGNVQSDAVKLYGKIEAISAVKRVSEIKKKSTLLRIRWDSA